jgi:redox-sensitive bicupin YhaK (pirin superfamily)
MTDKPLIKAILNPRDKDIGEFSVRRALPFAQQRSIGPWVFFDHFGPVSFEPGGGINVRPHPHINIATVTYLFEGEIFHRDSLGNALPIHPGAINLMVAGRGITHSERTRDELRASGYDLHGLQLWHALPEEAEEVEPAFYHTPAADIPQVERGGVTLRVMMGQAYGVVSPVKTFSEILYVEAAMEDGAVLELPQSPELGIYVVEGEGEIGDEAVPINAMTVVSQAAKQITARGKTRLAMIGGAPLGHRYLEWNFVSSRKDRITQAKSDWKSGKFDTVPGDDEEYIPLPD